jgi:hypothetical protein
MELENAIVKLLQETAENIQAKQFLMNCEVDLKKEKATLWLQNSGCELDFCVLRETFKRCPEVKTSCRVVKQKPKITLITDCND